MKKLMILVAIAMSAIVSQAALANWKFNASNIYDGGGTSAAKISSATAYIYDAAVLSQSAFFAAYMADKSYDYASKAVSSKAISSGTIAVTTSGTDFSYGDAGTNYSFYFAIVDGDNVYFSNEKGGAGSALAAGTSLAFSSQANGSSTFSKDAPVAGYQGTGHWSLASVPEPTSGLMMLIGVGLMALKRKRA